jgi:sucrose phosphorylase
MTKNGRDINRHNYTLEEIAVAIRKPVVQRLLKLMEFRNRHAAFNGQFAIDDAPDDQLRLSWKKGPHEARLHIDLNTYTTLIIHCDEAQTTMTEYVV